MPQNSRYLEYFENIAGNRSRYSRISGYYHNDIIEHCNYFSHEEFSVLDIGCGTGELLNKIQGRKKTGIDFSPATIRNAKDKFPDVAFQVMSAENLELNDKYDLVILSNLIGFLGDIEHVFRELKKVSHERTKVIIIYYNYLWEPVAKFAELIGLKMKSPAQNWLSRMDINNLLYLAGFDVYRTTTRMLLPVYLPVLSWLLNTYISKLPFIRHLGLNIFSFAKPYTTDKEETVNDKYSTSVVIPARNESGNIEDAILRMPKLGKSTEIVFVEGNSTDNTWGKIKHVEEKYKNQYNIKTARQDGKGKGDAVRKGFGIASGDILMILDADLTVAPEDLPKFYNAIATGKGDFINGCRLVYTMEKRAMRFLNLLGNKFFSILFTWLLEQNFKDTLCGTKVIFRDDYRRLIKNRAYFGDFDPFGDFDLIFGAHKLNLKITELPVRYQERTYGSTNISRFRHGLLLLKMCFFAARKIKFR